MEVLVFYRRLQAPLQLARIRLSFSVKREVKERVLFFRILLVRRIEYSDTDLVILWLNFVLHGE